MRGWREEKDVMKEKNRKSESKEGKLKPSSPVDFLWNL